MYKKVKVFFWETILFCFSELGIAFACKCFHSSLKMIRAEKQTKISPKEKLNLLIQTYMDLL